LRNPSPTMPTALRSSGIRLLAGLLGLMVVLAGSRAAVAEAENSAAIDKITKANKKAVDAYQDLNFEEARRILKDALELASQSGLETHPVTARTYVHLGVVVLAGFKQTDEAVKLFRKALQIQPDIKLDKSLANPEIQEVYDQAAKAEAGEKTKPPAGGSGEGITHEPVSKSPQGSAIQIKATVDPGLGAKKVTLSFSADGADDFAEKDMKEDPPGSGNWVGEIPSSAAQGGIIDYFIEAMDDDDKVLAAKGSNDHTLKIALTGVGGQPVAGAGRKKKPTEEPSKEEEGPSWYIGLGFGSGIGWTTGYGEVNGMDRINPAGFAPSSLGHVAPEVGYFLNPSLLLSLQLRFQFVSGATTFPTTSATDCGGDGVCSPATTALALFARASFFLAEGDFRPYVAATVGGGQIRHLATFASLTNCGPNKNQTCVDTVAAGPVFLGGGGGFLYNLTPSFALTLGGNLLLGFTTFTFHVDVNAGVAFMF
jgi:Tfp pilus assembly protein PilF